MKVKLIYRRVQTVIDEVVISSSTKEELLRIAKETVEDDPELVFRPVDGVEFSETITVELHKDQP